MCYCCAVHRAALVSSCLLTGLLLACARAPDGPPNLLLLTVDTLRADRLGCYGGEPDVGVALCGLADDGVLFRWALASASHTAPSVASILTSRYPAQHGVVQAARSYLRPDLVTLPEVLRGAGYRTAAFVSNPVLNKRRRFDQGFEVFDAQMTRRERNRRKSFEREAEATTDAALRWAERATAPWFLWVHFQDPHGPYDPPGGSAARDAPGEPELPVMPTHSGRGGIPAYQALPGLHTQRAYEARYLDEIRYLDGHVARLLAGLEALGPRPAVLLTADHGEAFGEDGHYFAHGHSVGLDQIRVPLVWRPARPGRARVVDTPVSLLDVAPTLLRAAGLESPASFAGRPLPLDPDAAPDPDRAIFAEHRDRAAVVVGRAYFARDRGDTAAAWHPPRVAELGDAAALPDYVAGDGRLARTLEPLLASHLESAAAAPRGPAHAEVPAEVREQLELLGYTE